MIQKPYTKADLGNFSSAWQKNANSDWVEDPKKISTSSFNHFHAGIGLASTRTPKVMHAHTHTYTHTCTHTHTHTKHSAHKINLMLLVTLLPCHILACIHLWSQMSLDGLTMHTLQTSQEYTAYIHIYW